MRVCIEPRLLRRAVIELKMVKAALVLDDHAGAKLCRFDAAICSLERWMISEILQAARLCDAVHAE